MSGPDAAGGDAAREPVDVDEVAALAADVRAFVGWQRSIGGRHATAELELPAAPPMPGRSAAPARREGARGAGAPPPYRRRSEAPERGAAPRAPERALPGAGAPRAPGWEAPRAPERAPPQAPVPGAPAGHGTPTGPANGPLRVIRDDLGDCRRCRLHEGRSNIVFGVGNPDADVVFVGEGPGYYEDQRGEPFVGKAGQLLDRIIENVLRLSRSEVYICNVVKCRPPQNRDPEPDEIQACSPFLLAQLDAVRPAVIIALGRFAAQTLLQTNTGISRLRGQVHPYRGVPLVPTLHPAYLLRNPEAKRDVFADMKLVRQVFAERTGRELPPIARARG